MPRSDGFVAFAFGGMVVTARAGEAPTREEGPASETVQSSRERPDYVSPLYVRNSEAFRFANIFRTDKELCFSD
jgi:hypothetical protein